MKKCPFCKAEIEENARFCLYCMKPLTKKETVSPAKRKKFSWLPVVLGILLLLLLAAAALLLAREKTPDLPDPNPAQSGEATDGSSAPTLTGDTEPLMGGTEPAAETTAATSPTQPDAPTGEQPVPAAPPSDTPPATQPAETQPKATEPPATEPEVTEPETTEPETTEPETTEPEVTDPPVTEPEEDLPETTAPQGPVYAYRLARTGDDFAAHYTNSGNDIVIIGITEESADGVYNIPSTIDGKRVIAIMANAFTGSNARTVYLPATVRTVWNYAFAGCALRHIYLRASSVYLESKAFPDSKGILTIHCAADCDDRAFRYYKNSAEGYGATWKEWNG